MCFWFFTTNYTNSPKLLFGLNKLKKSIETIFNRLLKYDL